MMSRESVFSHDRREFIARSIMDVVKLVFAAGVVGGFFVSAPMPLRVTGFAALAIAAVISVATFPKKKES